VTIVSGPQNDMTAWRLRQRRAMARSAARIMRPTRRDRTPAPRRLSPVLPMRA
jgi:hypothetical protein